jgi:hypothetical protein
MQTLSHKHEDILTDRKSTHGTTRSDSTTSTRSLSTQSQRNCYFVGKFPLNSIAGYTGHLPGIYPEGKYGASQHRLLQRINVPSTRRVRSSDAYRPGLDVVGYTGFVPRKQAGNVFGETFAKSNFSSQKMQIKSNPSHRAHVSKILEEYHRLAPSNEHGNFGMYKGAQK